MSAMTSKDFKWGFTVIEKFKFSKGSISDRFGLIMLQNGNRGAAVGFESQNQSFTQTVPPTDVASCRPNTQTTLHIYVMEPYCFELHVLGIKFK